MLFQKSGPWRDILESAGCEIRFPQRGGAVLGEAQLATELPGVHATIASTEPYTPAILNRAESLRVVSRTGVGYDSVHLATATSRGIAVGWTPGTNHESVAEQLFALLLAIAKNVVPSHLEVAGGGFRRQTSRALRGRVLGLVGCGRIGRAVAQRAAAFGMSVIAFDPFVSTPPADASFVKLVSFEELLARSDVISLHAAATSDTSRLIRQETIAQMKDGVILLNTARGTLIDEAALCAALQSGKVAAAGLDVFDQEPPRNSPLVSAPNVVLSPHLAGTDEQAIADMAVMAAQTIADLIQGRWPGDRIVNAAQLPQPWSWSAGIQPGSSH